MCNKHALVGVCHVTFFHAVCINLIVGIFCFLKSSRQRIFSLEISLGVAVHISCLVLFEERTQDSPQHFRHCMNSSKNYFYFSINFQIFNFGVSFDVCGQM